MRIVRIRSVLFTHLFIYSFIHLFIYSFTHLLIYSFTHLLIYSFTHLLKLPLYLKIALRYLFGKKSTNAINIITGISVFGIAIGTAALILILSVFNGFEELMKKYLDAFKPGHKNKHCRG